MMAVGTIMHYRPTLFLDRHIHKMSCFSRDRDSGFFIPSLISMKHFRIATIVLSCAGVLFNAIVTTSQLAFMWHNFRSEQVSEREDIQRYMVETGSAFWGFFLLYFLASAGVCFTAFIAALEVRFQLVFD